MIDLSRLPFHGYQDDAIDFALERQGSNLFARPGKGKTRIALETIESTSKRTLVVAPLFPAMTTWRQEAEKWGYNFDMRLLHGKEKKQGSEDVSIINYEGLLWLREQPWLDTYEYIIYDEVSKMKSPGSRRFKKWRRVVESFDYRMGLTGTPIGNRVLDLWGETFVIEGKKCALGRRYLDYQREFFYPHPYIKNYWVLKDPALRDEIFELIRPNALALDYGDDELPPLMHNKIMLPLTKAARQAYVEMKQANVIQGTDVVAVNAGVRSQKLRQIAAGNVYDDGGQILKLHKVKQQALRNLVDELGGDPLLVGFEFKHDLTSIRDALGYEVPALHGETKAEDMAGIVAQWNRGELPVLAGHPSTMGMGGNMQESGNNACFYTVPWSLELVEQFIDRIWRQGQQRRVTAHYMLVEDTKDEEVFEAKEAKAETQDALFDALSR